MSIFVKGLGFLTLVAFGMLLLMDSTWDIEGLGYKALYVGFLLVFVGLLWDGLRKQGSTGGE